MNHYVIISAPFGNYLQFAGTIPTLGTYTLHRRAGFWRRWWRVLKTVRFARGTVVNQLGLPSPGIDRLPPKSVTYNPILSIHGFTEDEWVNLARIAYKLGYLHPELNLSCPNVSATSVVEAGQICRRLVAMEKEEGLKGFRFIAKLPPVRTLDYVHACVSAGVTQFHLCNTIPTSRGGVGGLALKPFSLAAIEQVRFHYGQTVHIIGGGGVRSVQDARDYLDAGADDVAIGSVLFNPLRWGLIDQVQDCLAKRELT